MIDFGCILSTFTPDQEELGKVKRLSDDLIREISKYCQGHNIKAEPILVGSSSRGTSLKGADIDIFIRFHRSYEIREMERLGLQIGHAVLRNGIEKYAEHPYVSSYEFVQKVDIVPCFIINDASEKLTSVDRTPLHNEYLKKHLSDAQKKEVILLKLFLRRQGIYGSELKTNGFSGYVTELLIVNFGSFLSTLNHLSTLKGNLVIGDPNSVKRFESPVIIIDPTDPIRNAGAAVSLTSLSIFKLSSKAFIKNPSEDYFGMGPIRTPRKNVDRGTKFFLIKFRRPDVVDDIIFPQVQKMISTITRASENLGFRIINWEQFVGEVGDNVEVLLELEYDQLPAMKVHRGPPVDIENALSFIEKHKGEEIFRGPYVKDDRVYAELKNGNTEFLPSLKNILEKADLGRHINKIKGEFIIERYEGKPPESEVTNIFLSRKNPSP